MTNYLMITKTQTHSFHVDFEQFTLTISFLWVPNSNKMNNNSAQPSNVMPKQHWVTFPTSIWERSDNGSELRLGLSGGDLRPPPELILAATGSLGGGGRADLTFPDPGGGARPKLIGLGFTVPDSPAADNIPVPLVGFGFTFILIVSPSFRSQTNTQINEIFHWKWEIKEKS